MLDMLLAVSWRVLVLALLAAAATWALRRRPADLRHAVWFTLLAAMLLLPVLTWLLRRSHFLPAFGQAELLDLTDLQLSQTPAKPAPRPAPAAPSNTPLDWSRIRTRLLRTHRHSPPPRGPGHWPGPASSPGAQPITGPEAWKPSPTKRPVRACQRPSLRCWSPPR